ncbi:hypothetical protein MRX96_023857 [Rhipicephalus microplus]
MIPATLYHVLLPLVQMVCPVAPVEHAPSFYHWPNQIAVPLVLASPSSDNHDHFVGLGGCATTLSSNTLVFALQMITAALFHVLLPLLQTISTVAPREHALSFYHYPMQMITATLCHMLLPLVQTVCSVAPREHAPSFYNYQNKIAIPLVLASPKERISTSYYWMLQ